MTTCELEASWTAVEATVRGYLHRRLGGDDATADDLIQEVFLRMRRGLEGLRAVSSLGPWVSRIARSVLIDHLRRQGRDVSMPGVMTAAPMEDADDRAAIAAFLKSEVDNLPAHEAAAIRLVDLHGVAPTAAAEQIGIGLPALKARLRRGRQHLRQAIDRCCVVALDARGRPTDCEPHRGTAGCPFCA
ncbi:hypothetical protein LBMAG53_31500 [Planctomycetota bacterium]|nr:hypothetical protein LBMAG53_31500 [Planctomycetota bacterium]